MTPDHYLQKITTIICDAKLSLYHDELDELHLLLSNVVDDLGEFLEGEE